LDLRRAILLLRGVTENQNWIERKEHDHDKKTPKKAGSMINRMIASLSLQNIAR